MTLVRACVYQVRACVYQVRACVPEHICSSTKQKVSTLYISYFSIVHYKGYDKVFFMTMTKHPNCVFVEKKKKKPG